MSVAIKIETAEVQRLLDRAQAALAPGKVALAAGRGIANRVRAHLQTLEETRPNKEGFPRQHFWSQVRRSVNVAGSESGAVISISHVGFAQRLYGGRITAIRGKYLTIPAIAEAYGHRAREFSNLEFGFALNKYGAMQPALVEAEATAISFGRKKKSGGPTVKNLGQRGGQVFFWLTHSVKQKPDPTLLPGEQELSEAGRQGAQEYANDVLAKGGLT